MSLLAMAWRYLLFRKVATILTAGCIALGVALVCAVLALQNESEKALTRDAALYDLVAGGRGALCSSF